MSELDEIIARARARSRELQERAQAMEPDVIDAVADYVVEFWSSTCRSVVASNPDRARENLGAVKALQNELSALSERAAEIAADALPPALWNRLSDEELLDKAKENSTWDMERTSTRTSGWQVNRRWDESIRSAAGALGPLIVESGFGGDQFDRSSGRYRYAMPTIP